MSSTAGKRNFEVHTPSSWEDLPLWTQVINLLRNLLGKAETRLSQLHRSCKHKSSPTEKGLETKTLYSFRKINLSTNLFYAPKSWFLGPWFVQEKRLGEQTVLALRILSCAVEDGLLWVCLVSQLREGRHKMLIQEAILLWGVMKYIFVCWGTLMS